MNIIITGAGKGIGYELSKLAAYNNHHVLAISINIEKTQTLSETYNTLIPVSFDLSSDDFNPLLPFVMQLPGQKTDILINNAGHLFVKPFEQTSDEELIQSFRVNVFAIYKLSRLLLPFLNPLAHIVNIGSMSGFQGSAKFPGLSAYTASKAAVNGLSEAMAAELDPAKVRVNCLALGAVQTEMFSKAFPDFKAPLTAAQMAVFILDFALNAHKSMNGKVIPVSMSTP